MNQDQLLFGYNYDVGIYDLSTKKRLMRDYSNSCRSIRKVSDNSFLIKEFRGSTYLINKKRMFNLFEEKYGSYNEKASTDSL